MQVFKSKTSKTILTDFTYFERILIQLFRIYPYQKINYIYLLTENKNNN